MTESPESLFDASTHNFGIPWTSWIHRNSSLSVKLHSYFTTSHDFYFPFMSTKLPIKLIPWFEKWEKYTVLLRILICLLNIDIEIVWSMVQKDRNIQICSSSAKCLCIVLAFFSNKILGNINESMKFEIPLLASIDDAFIKEGLSTSQ